MDKGLACGFDIILKKRTEFNIDEVSNIYSVIVDIVLHDSEEDYAKSALILKATFNGRVILLLYLIEVGICAGGLHESNLADYILKVLLPKGRFTHPNDLTQRFLTIHPIQRHSTRLSCLHFKILV